MRLLLVLVLSLFSGCIAFAQKRSVPKITADDLRMTVYPGDSSADAAILDDYTYLNLPEPEGGYYKIRQEFFRRIKIFRKSAYERATISIPQYRNGNRSEEFVVNVRGRTYWLENGVIQSEEFRKSALFESKAGDRLYLTKFTLPHVQEGCIIEYQYELASDFIFQPKDWFFQTDIPVRRSECAGFFPPKLYYRTIFQNPRPLKVNKTDNDDRYGMNYQYVVEDVPAIRTEPYTTNPEDYLARLRFELERSALDGIVKNYSNRWTDIDKSLINDDQVGRYLRKTSFLKELAQAIRAAHPDTLGMVAEAQKTIRQLMTWNGKSRFWSESTPKTIFEQKTGNSAEINLLLIGLVRELNLPVFPVLLSTRDNGMVFLEFPMLSYFNEVVGVTYIGGKPVFLDATDAYLPLGTLPYRCLNKVGRIVDRDKADWIYLAPVTSREVISLEYNLKADASLTGKIAYTWSGYEALNRRHELIKSSTEKLARSWILGQLGEGSVSNAKAEFLEDPAKSFVFSAEIAYEDACTRTGDRLYLDPSLGRAISRNQFKHATRLYPVDFGHPTEQVVMATVNLPEGYLPEALPAPKVIVLPEDGGRFTFQMQLAEDKQLLFVSRLQLKKPVYTSDEYPYLKQLMDMVIAKHTEKVVLKKK